MAATAGKAPRIIRPWWAAVVPLCVVIGSLVLLVLLSWRTQSTIQKIRAHAVGHIEPAQRLVVRLTIVQAQDDAARRALAVTGDARQFGELHALFAEEARIHEQLRAARANLGPAPQAALDRLDRAAADWDDAVGDDVVLSDDVSAALAAALTPAAEATFAARVDATRSLEAALQTQRESLRQQVRARERRQLEVNWALAALALLAVVTLFVLGRHTRSMAMASREREAEIERLADEKERFIRGITHDLKNPLSAVDAYAQLLDAGIRGPLNDEQREFVLRIRRATQETLGTVNDLLELSRAANVAPSVKLSAADLRQVVIEVVEANRITAELFGVSIDADPGDPRPPVTTDAVRVRQVLGNLLSNALKYSPRGGTVKVSLRSAAGPWIGIEVADQGPGIAREERERVFDEYYRGEVDRPGSGLGLAASRRIAELLGGRVELDSDERGSTFRLLLPLEDAVAADGRKATAAARA